MRNLFPFTIAVLLAAPAGAQQNVEARVGKLESEMRAVQRRVFPGGAGQLLQPEIAPPEGATAAPGVPASTAAADLTARVSTLERQLQTMTDQVEQNGYRIRQLDEAFAAYRRATDARLKVAEDRPAASSSSIPAAAAPEPEEDVPAAATRPAAARPAAAVERPDTGDAGEDAYMYGYRLWEAKRYAEAERQLKDAVAKHPKHRRASYAQNLLGRTYLDNGKPSLASIAFYDNYKKMPDGERAPHSLYYLAQALQTLKKPADACKVYGELVDVYGTKIDARMKADIANGRAAAKCAS